MLSEASETWVACLQPATTSTPFCISAVKPAWQVLYQQAELQVARQHADHSGMGLCGCHQCPPGAGSVCSLQPLRCTSYPAPLSPAGSAVSKNSCILTLVHHQLATCAATATPHEQTPAHVGTTPFNHYFRANTELWLPCCATVSWTWHALCGRTSCAAKRMAPV